MIVEGIRFQIKTPGNTKQQRQTVGLSAKDKSMVCWAKMKSSSWAYPTAVLSLYGFFANCRMAEPFLTPYLIGPHKNISEEVVRMTDIYCINILYIYI